MHRDVVALDQEPLTGRLLGGPGGDVALRELGHGSARRANEMVMVAVAAQPIDDIPTRAGDRVHRPALHEKSHRALRRALPEARGAAATAREQQGEGQSVAGVVESVEDGLALGRSAHAIRAQATPDRLGSRRSHGNR